MLSGAVFWRSFLDVHKRRVLRLDLSSATRNEERMNDQRAPEGEVPLSALLAPSRGLKLTRGPVTPDGWVIFKEKIGLDSPSAAYIAACRREGLSVPEQKPGKLQGPIDAEDYPAALQIFYVKLAAMHGDWRAMRGTQPTVAMKNYFVTARAKYLAWQKRRDEEEEREATLSKSWFEIEPGHWALATSLEAARAFTESMKPIENHFTPHERAQFDIDMSKTCPRCKMRRVEPGTTLCGNCFSLGYT